MQNQYKLIINLDKENKEKYKKDFIEKEYNILIDEENLIFVKKENEKNTNIEKESEIIEYTVNILKKCKLESARIIDLSKDINSMLERVKNVEKIDYKTDKQKICWQVRTIMTREILESAKDINNDY